MRILLIEDDPAYLDLIIDNVKDSFVVDAAFDSSDASYLSEINDYDLIYVDNSLPDKPGITVCQRLRDREISSPILFAYDSNLQSLRTLSLEYGADLSLQKPFNSRDLRANIQSLLRRKYGSFSSNFKYKHLEVDLMKKSVRVSGNSIVIRRKEYEILEYLIINKGKVVGQEELIEHLWRPGTYNLSNVLEVHIKNLRDKIDRPYGTKIITTVYGLGYKISVG